MLDLLKQTISFAKEDPTEFFGSIAVLLLTFGMFYVSMWIFY